MLRIFQKKSKDKFYFMKEKVDIIPTGLTSNEVYTFSKNVFEDLGVELPNEYKEFLEYMNGYSYNGLVIFSKFNDEIKNIYNRASEKTRDLICWNKNYREMTDTANYLILGKTSLEYVNYNSKNAEYEILSSATLDCIKSYKSFVDAIKYFFE